MIWVVGLAAYMVGVMQRTSFGIAGLDAAARFDATPAVLSGFVVLQLLVYASLQVPAGVLLDRFGARKLVVAGALIMAAGQLLLAVATGLPLAITARVLVGAGDALTFISVLSVVAAWFTSDWGDAAWLTEQMGDALLGCAGRSAWIRAAERGAVGSVGGLEPGNSAALAAVHAALDARRPQNAQQGGPVSGHPAVVEPAYSASRR